MGKKIENGHVLWEASDFTDEQISDESFNGLVNAVVEGGLGVCKLCGEYEAGLNNPCVPKKDVVKGEKLKKYWFTFGSGHKDRNGVSLGNNVVAIEAENETEARIRMWSARGSTWAFSYKSAEEAGVSRFGLVELTLKEVALPGCPEDFWQEGEEDE